MNSDSYFIAVGFLMYAVNYSVGWLLYFGLIKVSKMFHQIIYVLLIVSLILIIVFTETKTSEIILYGLSLLCMFILPLGTKGEGYHVLVSTIGILLFISALLV